MSEESRASTEQASVLFHHIHLLARPLKAPRPTTTSPASHLLEPISDLPLASQHPYSCSLVPSTPLTLSRIRSPVTSQYHEQEPSTPRATSIGTSIFTPTRPDLHTPAGSNPNPSAGLSHKAKDQGLQLPIQPPSIRTFFIPQPSSARVQGQHPSPFASSYCTKTQTKKKTIGHSPHHIVLKQLKEAAHSPGHSPLTFQRAHSNGQSISSGADATPICHPGLLPAPSFTPNSISAPLAATSLPKIVRPSAPGTTMKLVQDDPASLLSNLQSRFEASVDGGERPDARIVNPQP